MLVFVLPPSPTKLADKFALGRVSNMLADELKAAE